MDFCVIFFSRFKITPITPLCEREVKEENKDELMWIFDLLLSKDHRL